MKELEFYFDFVSNNAYLAWTQLPKLCRKHDLTIRPVPVLFTGLLNSHANVGPAEIPAKRTWMTKNILRKAALVGVPMSPPIHHPFNPLLALRACSAPIGDKERERLINALFEAVWVNQRHVSDLEQMREVIEQAGLDSDAILDYAGSQEAKDLLRDNTEAAVAKGVFGIPSMRVEGELFFGYDDFPFIESFLQGGDPVEASELKRWQQTEVIPSSERGAFKVRAK
jgi:2-hydroxychromene-2-carboxylate isomerase